jgi:hypothetical protein
MSSQSNQAPELNRADTSEAPMTGEDRFAKLPAQLNELLERGEISLEAFAVYTTMAEALSSTLDSNGGGSNVVPIDLDEREVSSIPRPRPRQRATWSW